MLNLHQEEEEGEEEGEVDSEDNQETRELAPICTIADAKKHLEEIRRYLESCAHTTDSDFSAINHLDSAFSKAAGKKQSVIEDYFQSTL